MYLNVELVPGFACVCGCVGPDHLFYLVHAPGHGREFRQLINTQNQKAIGGRADESV